MSRLMRIVPLLALVIVAAMFAVGCGDGDSSDAKRADGDSPASTTAKTETTDTTDDTPEPTKVPEPVPAGEQPPIVISSPKPFETAVRTLVVRGTARVFEGGLHWAILGADLRPLVEGNTTASCGAPCRGRYAVRIPLAKVPLGSYELHVWAPDASGREERQHDTMVPVTISDQLTPGTPAPGTVPPGGPPQR